MKNEDLKKLKLSTKKAKYKHSYTEKHAYQEYLKLYPKGHSNYVDSKTYKDICSTFHKKIVKYIIYKSGTFIMPYGMGKIRIMKKKTPLSHPRFNFTEKGKRSYFFNDHREGYFYKWNWERKGGLFYRGMKYYKFVPSRTIKRELAHVLKTQKKIDYFE